MAVFLTSLPQDYDIVVDLPVKALQLLLDAKADVDSVDGVCQISFVVLYPVIGWGSYPAIGILLTGGTYMLDACDLSRPER